MACRFLTIRPLHHLGLVAAVLAAIHVSHARAEVACKGELADGKGLHLSDASGSPLYGMLRTTLGNLTACTISSGDFGQNMAITFPKGGSLNYSVNEAIELSSQDASLPEADAVPISEAISKLRAVEKWAAAPDGCGIAWSKLNAAVSSKADVTADGTSCNCKAGLRMKNGTVVGLRFSLAC